MSCPRAVLWCVGVRMNNHAAVLISSAVVLIMLWRSIWAIMLLYLFLCKANAERSTRICYGLIAVVKLQQFRIGDAECKGK